MNWIKTSEQAPTEENQYLAVRRGYIEILTFNKFYNNWDDADGDDFECDFEKVSHWMPLPNLPQKELGQ